MAKIFSYLALIFAIFSCSEKTASIELLKDAEPKVDIISTSLILLGTIQDAGYPQIACKKSCCIDAFKDPNIVREVISLGLIDTEEDKTYLFEATPDMVKQMKRLTQYEKDNPKEIADGIFLTHAHIGHYTGLMYLGKEAMDAKQVPVYAMPKMKTYLENDGPWSQLVKRENISLQELKNDQEVQLSEKLQVTPLQVPHRDEYSETVAYKIKGPNKSALFIPDIDKWEKWDRDIIEEIKKVDYAFVDATFYSGAELAFRDISQIPHPFIIESLEKFSNLPTKEKSKIIFIHFNHTNPVVDLKSEEAKKVQEAGFRIGKRDMVFEM